MCLGVMHVWRSTVDITHTEKLFTYSHHRLHRGILCSLTLGSVFRQHRQGHCRSKGKITCICISAISYYNQPLPLHVSLYLSPSLGQISMFNIISAPYALYISLSLSIYISLGHCSIPGFTVYCFRSICSPASRQGGVLCGSGV